MLIGKRNNFIVCILIISVFLTLLHPLGAMSVRILPGGVPIISTERLMEEGVRRGDPSMLRQAWKEYERAVQLDENAFAAYLQLGRIYFHLSLLEHASDDDFLKAKHYVSKAMDMEPGMAEVHHVMGLILSGKGAYLDALSKLKFALSMNPTNEFILCDLASIHVALHQPEETIKLLEGKNLRNGWSYFVLAMAWLQGEHKGKALLNLLKAKKIGADNYWLNLAIEKMSEDLSLPLK